MNRLRTMTRPRPRGDGGGMSGGNVTGGGAPCGGSARESSGAGAATGRERQLVRVMATYKPDRLPARMAAAGAGPD